MTPPGSSVEARAAQAARVFAACLLPMLVACSEAAAPPLPKLKLQPSRIAVLGLSSGAYMATQAHLAFSNHIIGAALVAGGPYGCAQGSLDIALGPCITALPSTPDAAALAQAARERMANGQLAPVAGLAGDRVLVLHGRQDETVAEAASIASADFYRALAADPAAAGMAVQWDGQRDFGHNLPVASVGPDCAKSEPPYLGRCGWDAAGEVMRYLFSAEAIVVPGTGDGELRRFSQSHYLTDGEDAFLDDSGYVYLPKTCLQGTPCGLLIAFHGCQQNAATVGEAFVRDGGFNRWADALAVVVLYPQTRSSYLPLNPKACWDWWGYSGADYDTRTGVQLRWLANAVAALGARLD